MKLNNMLLADWFEKDHTLKYHDFVELKNSIFLYGVPIKTCVFCGFVVVWDDNLQMTNGTSIAYYKKQICPKRK